MASLLDHFPVFEANQVLMAGLLNDVFDYHDEHGRQTRSHLVGVGIVCGLEIKRLGSVIALSRGCGVTSEGYLIVEPHDLSLTAYRDYTLPADIDYPPFRNGSKQYLLWELFEDGVPNTTPLATPAKFLDDKAVLLFLELKKAQLRNCSPNNCDDKGSQVTATVRRLLIAQSDLDKIVAAANALGSWITTGDLDAALSARLDLPDLRLRRFDVPNTHPVTSNDVYAAFLGMMRTGRLVHVTGDALGKAYAAFRPLLAARYPSDPFANFIATYGFLDSAPINAEQVRFLQYYADFFDDLLRAYDEFRWAGLELNCACCPDDRLFPRHLVLGLLNPAAGKPDNRRQGFVPSPAIGDCARKTEEVLQLFARLVEMAARFTNAPQLPSPEIPPTEPGLIVDSVMDPRFSVDPQIRITPSVQDCGDRKLEDKAIPYYYVQTGSPPLYQLWSPTKTRRNRANCNLGYHSDQYAGPVPDFVARPLYYDLEPYNFLRIEGHLGKDYQRVMRTLLLMRLLYRLPIDIIALRTGAYDERQPIDMSNEAARFQDLESLYAVLRSDLMSALSEGVRQLYERTIKMEGGPPLDAGTPELRLLQEYAPHFRFLANSLGSWYEHYLQRFEQLRYLNIGVDPVEQGRMTYIYSELFSGTQRPNGEANPHVAAIYYFSKLAESLPPTLGALNYADFEHKYQDMLALIRFFRSSITSVVPREVGGPAPDEAFLDLCESILLDSRLDAIKAAQDSYAARVAELKRLQCLSNFLQREPGIQHKAGVPLGGTFIVVYHGEPVRPRPTEGVGFDPGALLHESLRVFAATRAVPGIAPRHGVTDVVDPTLLANAIDKISADRSLATNKDLSLIIDWLRGHTSVPGSPGGGRIVEGDPVTGMIGEAVGGLTDGTVIADFFLPYQVSGTPGIQYVLPKVPPTFTTTVGCTGADGSAEVSIQAKGGVPPYEVAVDGGAYQALSGSLHLGPGNHGIRLRDADGAETPVQTVTVAQRLAISERASYVCKDGKYVATASISGGAPPYEVNGKEVREVVTDPTPSGTTVSVTVTDNHGCTATAQFSYVCPPPCTLPCNGIALNRNFRFFIPDPDPNNPYTSVSLGCSAFTVESAQVQGHSVPLDADAVTNILKSTLGRLPGGDFLNLVNECMAQINKLVASKPELVEAGKGQWLTLGYKPVSPGTSGLLSIEYFECLNFELRLEGDYVRSSGKTGLNVTYTSKGTSIQIGETVISIPPLDGTRTDKCSGTQPAPLCPAPRPSVVIQGPASAMTNDAVEFTVVVSDESRDLSFVWDAPDGTPAMGTGSTFKTRFVEDGKNRPVTITAFDAMGCSAGKSVLVQVIRSPR